MRLRCWLLEDELKNEVPVPVNIEGATLDAIANKIGLEKYITEQVFFDNRNQ